MKIIFFNPYADNSDMKGAARRIMFLSMILTRENIAFQAILKPDYEKINHSIFDRFLLAIGLRRLAYFLFALKCCRDKENIIISEVIFAPVWLPNFILTIHDLKAFDMIAARGGQLRNWAYSLFPRLASRIIVVTESVKSDLMKFCNVDPNRVFVVPNGIDDRRLKIALSTKNISKVYDFVYVSSFVKHKRHSLLIKAAPIGAKILLIGRDMGSLEEINKEIMLRRNEITVHVLLDVDTDEDLFNKIASAKCGIFPSSFEGFGIPLLEYAACGLYVIASNIPPFVELKHYVNEFFQVDNITELKAVMANFFDHEMNVPRSDSTNLVVNGAHTEAAITNEFLILLNK